MLAADVDLLQEMLTTSVTLEPVKRCTPILSSSKVIVFCACYVADKVTKSVT